MRKNGKSSGGRREPGPPLVSPAVATVASALVPGLGQILGRAIQRGLLLFGSVASILLMLAWRVQLLAHREPTAMDKLAKAFGRRPFFVGLIIACVALIWVWNAWDAWRQTAALARPRERRRGGFGIFALVLFTFFALGWQISQINPVTMAAKFPDALVPLSRVVWPWKAAVEREEILIKASAPIQVPCTDNPPAAPEEEPGKPYIAAEPTCGELSRMGENNQLEAGTTITVTGRNFQPDTDTEIWWADPLGNEFQVRQEGKYLSVMSDDQGSFQLKVIMPYRLIPPTASKVQMHKVEARQLAAKGPLKVSEPLTLTIERMVETIFMGMMATVFGIILSIPVSFLAARNIMSGSWITMGIYFFTRTILNIVRSIEPLIWALIAVVWVGLGPFAGILALTIHSVAALGKLYSEAIEGIDPGPIEAVQATGATRLQTIMYAVVPQMIAPFVSFSIYRWDINVRMSTVIGLVGGGGVGFILVQYIRLLDYRAAGIAVWFIAVTVAVLDYVSAEIRQRFV